jgi:hypothetical protein
VSSSQENATHLGRSFGTTWVTGVLGRTDMFIR